MLLMIISGISMAAVVLLYAAAKIKYGSDFDEESNNLSKDEYPMKSILFVGEFVVEDLLKNSHKRLFRKQNQRLVNNLIQINGARDVEEKVRFYYYNKFALLVFVMLIISVFVLIASTQIYTEASKINNSNIISRPEFGSGSIEEEYKVTIEDQGVSQIEEVSILVKEQSPTDSELQAAVTLASENLQSRVLGKNPSLDMVSSDLNFYKKDKSTNLELQYDPLDYELISSGGSVLNTELEEPSISTVVVVNFYYEGALVGSEDLALIVLPRKLSYTKEESLTVALTEKLDQINKQEQHVTSDSVTLPELLNEDLEGASLQWTHSDQEEIDYSGPAVFFCGGILLLGLVYYMLDEKVEQKAKERKDNIMMEFPIFVDRFVLLIGCGKSVDLAISHTLNSVIEKRPSKSIHPLYQELSITVNEIERLGISSIDALERFGRRCQIPDVMKFASLVGQAVSKGDNEVSNALSGLVEEVWQSKKALAMEKGSKASTKLLMPMMLMLMAVLVLVLAPAAMSMMRL